jgi:hypothetical protein
VKPLGPARPGCHGAGPERGTERGGRAVQPALAQLLQRMLSRLQIFFMGHPGRTGTGLQGSPQVRLSARARARARVCACVCVRAVNYGGARKGLSVGVYACAYAYARIYMSAYICASTYARIRMRVHVCAVICACIHTCVCMYGRVYLFVYMCVYLRMNIHVFACQYAYTHIYMGMYVRPYVCVCYAHVCMRVNMFVCI